MSFGATTYSHWAATGRRDWLIDVTTTCDITNGPISNIVDGVKANNNADGVFCNSAQSGREFKFAFPWPVRIDEFTWTQDSAGTQGTWTFAGSNDDISYTDLSTGINLGGAAAADVHAFTNTNGYKYYRLTQTAGTTTNSRWIQEVEFKLSLDSDYGLGSPATATSYSNEDGSGNRSARMLMLLDVNTACGAPEMNAMLNGVTGAQNCTDATAFSGTSGSTIKICFRDPIVIDAFTWKQNIVAAHGTWKIQGSTDDVSYTDLGTGIALGAGSTSEEFTFSNTSGYNFYKLVKTAGSVSGSSWLYEVEFKTAVLGAPHHYLAATAALEVLSSGDGSNANVAAAALSVLSSGDGSNAIVATAAIEVLSPVAPPTQHYFAASAAIEVLSTGDGSNAQVASAAIEVLNSGDGSSNAQAAAVVIEVLSTRALAPARAFDGTKIYEFSFAFTPETIYSEADWDSIYSVGNRILNGTLIWKQEGWAATFGAVNNLTDHNWGLSGGNGFGVGGQDGWPGGAFAGVSTADGSFQYISGFKTFKETAQPWNGYWIMFAGYDGVVWAVNHAEFDEFGIGYNSAGAAQLEFTPPFFPFNYWSFTLASIPESSDTDFPGNDFGSEFLFKVYHSVLDGGDRRATNGRPIKRVTMTHSSGIVDNSTPTSDPPFDAMANVFDGRYAGGNGGPNPPFGKTQNTDLRKLGWTFGDEAIENPGEWVQFSFPRKVFMREMVWNVGGSGEVLDSGGNPTIYGVWQWQASNAPTTGFVDVGEPWHFLPGSNWMKAPKPINEGNPSTPYQDYLYPYWRMVLVEGPAFGGGSSGSIWQIQFNLIDPNNQDPLYEIAFTDDADTQLPIITVGPAGSPYEVRFSDGDDDKLTATLNVVNNPVLAIAFSDATGDGLQASPSFAKSRVSQTMVVVKGR